MFHLPKTKQPPERRRVPKMKAALLGGPAALSRLNFPIRCMHPEEGAFYESV